MEKQHYHIVLHGIVQGIGFRPFVYRQATELGLTGFVRNDGSSVFVAIEGQKDALQSFLARLCNAPKAEISKQEMRAMPLVNYDSFMIAKSETLAPNAEIPPDFALCPECLAEFSDPSNRRYGYPFIACTQCGARASIIAHAPFERANTSMRGFVMCAECLAEFNDPESRRFHSELNSCARCGIALHAFDADNNPIRGDNAAILAQAVAALLAGKIIALKGIGGFALLCAATNTSALEALRARKNRPTKPFAVMFARLDSVREVAHCNALESALLQSSAAPIVLLSPREDCALPLALLAPKTPYLGAILPYTALHHAIMQSVPFPVVFTSANLSGEPIASDDEQIAALGGIYDMCISHNLPILSAHDDSVVAVVGDSVHCLRRSRGYPLLLPLARSFARPTLGLGSEQKSAPALGIGASILLAPPVGELSRPLSLARYNQSLAFFARNFAKSDRAIADLHPRYTSHSLAHDYEKHTLVQHHYAHTLALMAEHNLSGRVIGAVFDGSGYGQDKTIWGGEILLADTHGFSRAFHMRPLALLGGERAIEQPVRLALALLFEVVGEEALRLIPDCPPNAGNLYALWRKANAPRASSVGRLFDAVCVILCGALRVSYDGECGLMLESLCLSPREWEKEGGAADGLPLCGEVFDYAPLVRGVLAMRTQPRLAASYFVASLAHAVVSAARILREEHGDLPLLLCGGCFCNQKLLAYCKAACEAQGVPFFTHHKLAPTDSSLAVGQAYYGLWNP